MYTDIYMYPNGRNKCTGHTVNTPRRVKDMTKKEIQSYAQYMKDSYDFVGELVFLQDLVKTTYLQSPILSHSVVELRSVAK